MADLMEHIRRAGVLSVVPENAEIIVRADGVQQLAAVLQHVATSKAFAKQVRGLVAPVMALGGWWGDGVCEFGTLCRPFAAPLTVRGQPVR